MLPFELYEVTNKNYGVFEAITRMCAFRRVDDRMEFQGEDAGTRLVFEEGV
jgi:hypothetical protein